MANSRFPSAGGTNNPGGSNTQVQFNDAGSFGGDSAFTWDKSSNQLSASKASFGNFEAVDASITVLSEQLLAPAAGADNSHHLFYAYLEFNPALTQTSNGPRGLTADVHSKGSADQFDTTGIFGQAYHDGTGTLHFAYGGDFKTFNTAAGTVTEAWGVGSIVENDAAGNITLGASYSARLFNFGAGTITNGAAMWAHYPENSGGGAITNYFGYYHEDLALSSLSLAYYNWCDSRGVFAIKEEFTQAVPRLYNPTFAKYAPGAADYERWITRYGITATYGTTNVLYMGGEAGGTGTLRLTSLLGAGVQLESVPGTSTFLQVAEMTAPAAPAANGVRIYAVDNGGGKTQLMALFSSGAAQQIAIQP